MGKLIYFDDESREKLKAGVDTLANAVKVTLGPKGRNVVIGGTMQNPHITKDGVTVAKAIELDCPVANLGAQIVKDVAAKTADIAGDGTTTATVLAQSIINQGMNYLQNAKANPIDLKRGMDKAANRVVECLDLLAEDVRDRTEQIATISANGDVAIGKLISSAMQTVGVNGTITVEESKGLDTTMKVVEGMQFDRGFISTHFITNKEKSLVEMEAPLILIYDGKINETMNLIPILEPVVTAQKSLLIICEDLEGEALSTLITNVLRGSLKVAAVKAPSFGDHRRAILEDIAVLTGATLISSESGIKLQEVTMDMLGFASVVEITKDTTTLIDGAGDSQEVGDRIVQLLAQIESADGYERELLQARLAKLDGGVAVLSVGGTTEIEMKEIKDRVDDALAATKAAVEEGIVPGGGVALIRCISSLDDLKGSNEDETSGIFAVRTALEAPLRQIALNGGCDVEAILEAVKNGTKGFGYNAYTEQFEDLLLAGVIDPKKVTRTALQNAVSIASMLLTTECVIVDTTPRPQAQ
jgi:chaperonin GroEL